LIELISLARSYGASSILTTNGTLLTRQRVVELREAGIETFQISMHSHLPAVHDYLSGGVAWHTALAAMIRVRESGSHLVSVFVATSRNLSHFSNVLRMVGQLGVTQTVFNRFIPTGLGAIFKSEIGVPHEEQLLPILSEADKVASDHGIRIQLGTPIEVPDALSTTWRNIDLASCPVQVGQHRWTLSADLTLRRCNQSGSNIGSVSGGGFEKLVAELRLAPEKRYETIRSCGHLASHRLVKLGAS
jgi:hypothetical protein